MRFSIFSGYADQFKKYPHGAADYLGANYDINSLLHYFGDAFGKGGNLTIVPKDRPNFKIPKPKRMSAIDVQQVRKLYKCDEDKKEEGS